jgi:hypothetical protein
MGETAAHADTAVLVIRVWHEADALEPFRARIVYEGLGEKVEVTAPTSDPEDVVTAVREWLAEHS